MCEGTRQRRREKAALALLARFLLLAVVASGCGPGRPKTVKVTGTVTYRGQPLEGARVMFDCAGGRPASATTDASGRFTLETFGAEDGAILGEHTVTVSKYVAVPGGAGPAAGQDEMRSPGAPPIRQTVPGRYTTPGTSPLKASVTAQGPNDFTFELTD